MNPIMLKSLLMLILLCGYHAVMSMPEDRNLVMALSADSADLNQKTHLGKYLGDVQFDQGSTHLRAAKATTTGNNKNKLICATAEGDKTHQAHFWTLPALNKPEMHAYADIIRYYPERHIIELSGNARIVQGKNSFQAPEIKYDTEKQHVLSSSNGEKRTAIIIHPEKIA